MTQKAGHVPGGHGLRVPPGHPVTFVRWRLTRDDGWKADHINGLYQNSTGTQWIYRDAAGKTQKLPRADWNLSIP